MAISLTQRATVADNVLFRVIGNEAVLLNLKTEQYLGLDPVGTRMWTLLNESRSVQEAYEFLLKEYDVDADRLLTDMEEFIAKLVAQGLLVLKAMESA
jgi:hypothetical protein